MSDAAKNLVFLGPPGAGKGTQAATVAEGHGLTHVSTGDLFRANLRAETPIGLEAKGYMDRGELVPDETVCKMVAARLSEPDTQAGFLLDGFPRTMPQGEMLQSTLAELGRPLDRVVVFEVPNGVLVDRLTGRLTCKACGAIFHEKNQAPAKAGVCDVCGGELYTRKDDTVEAAEKRLEVYADETFPLIAFYDHLGLCARVNADQAIEAVRLEIEAHLAAHRG